jgi:hypothetical protein
MDHCAQPVTGYSGAACTGVNGGIWPALRRRMDHVSYSDLDLCEKVIELSKSKFPAINYYCVDLLGFDMID